jgi:DNA-3-methyladenine glycosylase II
MVFLESGESNVRTPVAVIDGLGVVERKAVAALTRATLAQAVSDLVARDRGLAQIVAAHGPPPLWARATGFATLVRIILEQQVSLTAAASLFRRVSVQLPGGMTPGAVVAAGPAGLRALGLTRQKARYVCALGELVQRGDLALSRLTILPDSAAAAYLEQVPGIGPWTSSIYLLMALRRPDVWPPGDLALHKALARLRRLPETPTTERASRLARRWMPYRAVAARILWHGYLADRAAQRDDNSPNSSFK